MPAQDLETKAILNLGLMVFVRRGHRDKGKRPSRDWKPVLQKEYQEAPETKKAHQDLPASQKGQCCC